MKWTKKKTVVTAIVVVVVAGVAISTNKSKAQQAAMANMVSTTQVTKGDIEDSLTQKAPLEGTESVEVVSRLSYEVLTVNVQEGEKVEKGQLLATLDKTDLQQELSDSRNNIALQELQLQETLEKRQTDYDNALVAYQEKEALHAAGSASAQELAEAKQRLESISVENGTAAATPAEQKSIANLKAALQTKTKALEDCEIRAQISGTVTRVNTRVGRPANQTENDKPMFVIENIEQLQMKVLVSEYDIAKVAVGQTVEISADILNGATVDGVVNRISPTGELKNGSTTERVIPVYIDIVGDSGALISGITAKAKIQTDFAANALILPFEAISEQADGSNVVYKLDENNVVSIVPITLGIQNDLQAQVIGDLSEGDTVILNPTPDLTEGQTVTPQTNSAM